MDGSLLMTPVRRSKRIAAKTPSKTPSKPLMSETMAAKSAKGLEADLDEVLTEKNVQIEVLENPMLPESAGILSLIKHNTPKH